VLKHVEIDVVVLSPFGITVLALVLMKFGFMVA
jgi:hypothetical protein